MGQRVVDFHGDYKMMPDLIFYVKVMLLFTLVLGLHLYVLSIKLLYTETDF